VLSIQPRDRRKSKKISGHKDHVIAAIPGASFAVAHAPAVAALHAEGDPSTGIRRAARPARRAAACKPSIFLTCG